MSLVHVNTILNLQKRRDAYPFDTDTKGRQSSWLTFGQLNRKTNVLDTRKVTQLN